MQTALNVKSVTNAELERLNDLQINLKKQLITMNEIVSDSELHRIAGVDISYPVNDPVNACVAVVILDANTMNAIYKATKMVKITMPYIAGYLAFREVDHMITLLNAVPEKLKPQVIFVDGNGVLHYHGFGLASHLGVLSGLPTIGIGKALLCLDGLRRATVRHLFAQECHKKGDYIPLIGSSGKVHGYAVKTQDNVLNPIYVSIGHRVNLSRALELTIRFSKFRVPEPVRYADHISRELLRMHK